MTPDPPPPRLFKKPPRPRYEEMLPRPSRERRLRQPRYEDEYIADDDFEDEPLPLPKRRKRDDLDDRFSPTELRRIARLQRYLQMYLVFSIVGWVTFTYAGGGRGPFGTLAVITYIVVTVTGLVPVSRLAFMISGRFSAVATLVVAAVPCLGFFAVTRLHDQATKELKAHGVRSGWFGVNRGDLDRLGERE